VHFVVTENAAKALITRLNDVGQGRLGWLSALPA
jgi:hypothetical protein